jgi:hypothetical protein
LFTLRVGISKREKEKEKSGVEKRWRPWGLSLVLWGVGIARDCESGESMSICVCGSAGDIGEACGEVYWGVGVSSSSEEVWTLAGLGSIVFYEFCGF